MTAVSLLRKLSLVVVASVALPWAIPTVLGKDEPHPIAAQVKADLKDPAKPFTLIIRLQVKDGMQSKFEAAFAKASKETHKEKGCIAYDLSRDTKDGTRYVVYERWKNLAALDAHLKTAYITTLLAELKEFLAAAPEVNVLLPAGE